MVVIGLVGLAGAGKDTVCNLLLKAYDRGGIRRAFADSLREELLEGFNLGKEDGQMFLHHDLKPLKTPLLALKNCTDPEFLRVVPVEKKPFGAHLIEHRTPREIMQWWGTDYRREQNRNYWVERMHECILQQLYVAKEAVVIPDCRFINESLYIKQVGGVLVRINRKLVTPKAIKDRHVSEVEQALIPCHFNVNNDGSLRELEGQVQWLVQSIAEQQWKQV